MAQGVEGGLDFPALLAEWNEWLRPLPFTLGVLVLLVFIVTPGATKLWKTLHASTAE
ncbi:hypothetical protein ACFY3M_41380 [Streptomyces mirabilis]|uniref:hypothetical protein n=1 Tax=Streptomyces mirabilis TaxID=68239 RepID=UPI00367E7CED